MKKKKENKKEQANKVMERSIEKMNRKLEKEKKNLLLH